MPSTDVFQSSLLPLGAVQLGRLVLNTTSPQQDFLDPPTDEPPEIIVSPQKNFEEIRTSAKAVKIRARISQLLSASYNKKQSNNIDLSATNAFTYMLCNSKSWFTKACGILDIRRWLQEVIEDGDDVYLVVGYHTLVDAHFSAGAETARTDSGGITVPLDPGGMPSVAGMDLSVGVDGSKKISHGFKRSFYAPGEQIYAVQYRKILFKWYSSRKIESGFLEQNNRWKIFVGRGEEAAEDEEDVVEVELSDEVELGEPDGKYISEDGTSEFIL